MARKIVTTMNKRVRLQWIKALEGRKYKQARSVLYRTGKDGGMCCLGVLCDLHAKETKQEWYRAGRSRTMRYLGNTGTLPLEVQDWAGLNDECPILAPDPDILTAADTLTAVHFNDEMRYSFKQIAKLVRNHVKGV